MDETGLPILGLNTRRGDVALGESGLAALPGREGKARAAIDEAVAYAAEINAGAVHVMAGNASGPAAHAAFMDNLRHAVSRTAGSGVTILIEPLNRHDAPGYFLRTTDKARAIIDEIAAPNLKLMFDCYHVARTEGDVTTRLAELLPIIGHIQVAGVPGRGRPDISELDYAFVFDTLGQLGWTRPIGAEYRPGGKTEDSLGWMRTLS